MRTYTDYAAWKSACRARGWTGPSLHIESGEKPGNHQFIDAEGKQRALWNNSTNTGKIFDEQEPGRMMPGELAVLKRWLKRMTGQSPAAESSLIKALIERHEAPYLRSEPYVPPL